MKMTANLTIQFLRRSGGDIDEYDGFCGELVDGMIHWLGEDRVKILYIEGADGAEIIAGTWRHWRYHMAPVIDGIVHDAWFPDMLLPPDEYVLKAFKDQHVVATIH